LKSQPFAPDRDDRRDGKQQTELVDVERHIATLELSACESDSATRAV
jgi:hypothetical protein